MINWAYGFKIHITKELNSKNWDEVYEFYKLNAQVLTWLKLESIEFEGCTMAWAYQLTSHGQ